VNSIAKYLQRDRIQIGQSVAAAGAAEGNWNMVVDQLAASGGEDSGRLIKHARYYWLLLAERRPRFLDQP